MERVAGLMENMRLSETEKKGIKIGGAGSGSKSVKDPQAVGKVLSEKPVRAEALELALGKVWCPIKGVECKDLGENRFLFTFFQASGKRRALDDGPWNFGGKDLVIMADFDGAKTIDEIEFHWIPMWVRITKMPLRFMTKAAREVIGAEIGEVLQVDAGENECAIGQFLRVKIKWDIRQPLLRGVTLTIEEGGKEKEVWCPLVYEFLLEFCYTCGIIGHIDKVCDVKLGKGEAQQFSSKLRFLPEKRRFQEEPYGRWGGRGSNYPWKSGGMGSKGSGGSGSWSSEGGRGSDGSN
ncbi:hypothetical protein ACP70R_036365 [Stipagrostis hirtigluma subsp. patula]